MTSFLWSSSAGAIDLAALVAVAGLALAVGPRRARVFATALVVVFLAHRALLATAGPAFMMTAGGLVDFVAAIAIARLQPNRMGRSMAALFGLKIATYVAFLAGVITFDDMAASATVWTYFQMILVLAAVVAHGPRIFRNRSSRRTSGPARDLPVAGRIPGA